MRTVFPVQLYVSLEYMYRYFRTSRIGPETSNLSCAYSECELYPFIVVIYQWYIGSTVAVVIIVPVPEISMFGAKNFRRDFGPYFSAIHPIRSIYRSNQ